jgi:hypothetical protein
MPAPTARRPELTLKLYSLYIRERGTGDEGVEVYATDEQRMTELRSFVRNACKAMTEAEAEALDLGELLELCDEAGQRVSLDEPHTVIDLYRAEILTPPGTGALAEAWHLRELAAALDIRAKRLIEDYERGI